ncbi:UV-B-induced protein, chloroplastic [Vitis vinifera]|uniref:UV-B-induced protein, chloroplastic n=1 Tax=Vitis vinifera TaxID=29760 RepID=A0A438GGP2_VITVI|nr:UV-B-induced protein, chloroplastic [Vitis vinifera]
MAFSPFIISLKAGHRNMAFGSKKCTIVRASASADSSGSAAPIAPLQLESPIGQFLSQILISHPHLVPAAVEQQLEQLQTDRDAEEHKEESSASGTELVLYSSSSSDSSDRVDTWPSQDGKLEQLHSPEAYEMIQNHLALILGNRLGDSTSVAQISKLRVGQVYAASVMYGYFLKRVDQRFQLEKTMKILPHALDGDKGSVQEALWDKMTPSGSDDSVQTVKSHPEVSSWAGGFTPGGFGHGIKPSRLRNYVMSFDAETLQRYATIRSKEAVSIIEKHTEALFGRPEIIITPQGTIDSSKDELIKISFGGLKRLVLEAVTFGSFLWDVESFVDSRYHFVIN